MADRNIQQILEDMRKAAIKRDRPLPPDMDHAGDTKKREHHAPTPKLPASENPYIQDIMAELRNRVEGVRSTLADIRPPAQTSIPTTSVGNTNDWLDRQINRGISTGGRKDNEWITTPAQRNNDRVTSRIEPTGTAIPDPVSLAHAVGQVAPTNNIVPPPVNLGDAVAQVLPGAKSQPVNLPGNVGPGVGMSTPGGFLGITPETINPQSGASKLDDIKSQLEALFATPDIPGYWESPVSQGYLNQLGNQFSQSGTDAQAALEAAKQDIVNNYANTGAQRSEANQRFTDELVGGLQNLGIDTGNSAMLDQASADAQYLNEVAAQNQATDTSFNDKLGQNAALLGSQLAMMAREGLFHPKQWVAPQSGLSDGDRLRASYLMGELDNERALQASTLDDGLTQEAEEEFVHQNPMFAEMLAGITDPEMRSYLQNQYDLGGGNVQDTLTNLAQTQTAPVNPFRNAEPPQIESGLGLLDALVNNTMFNEDIFQQHLQNKFDEQVMAPWLQEQEMARQATEFFRRLSPYYQGIITDRTMTDSYSG